MKVTGVTRFAARWQAEFDKMKCENMSLARFQLQVFDINCFS